MSRGARGLVARLAQMRVRVPCWPTRPFAGKTVPQKVFWPGSLLEPQFERSASHGLGDHRRDRRAEVLLNASCASGSVVGRCGRTESLRSPSAARYLPTVRSCTSTPKASATVLTDDGIGEIKDMLTAARQSTKEWKDFLQDFVADPDIIACVKDQSLR